MTVTARRAFLGMLAAGTAAGIAGCSSSCPDTDTPAPSHTVETADVGSGFDTLPDGSWPSPRFDAANTGYTPLSPSTATPSVRWRTRLPVPSTGSGVAAASPVVIADETVFVATAAGIFALSLRDGTEQWRGGVTPASVQSAVGHGERPASPVTTNGRVVLPTADGIVAFDTHDGTVAWRDTESAGTGVPAAAGDALLAPTADGLAMLDARDGSREWTADVDATMPAVAGDVVVARGDQTVALDAATGDRQWTQPTGGNDYPVVADGTVYLGTSDGLVGRSLADGTEQWRIDRGRFLAPPVVAPGSVYAAEQPGEASDAAFAFDRAPDAPPDPRWCSQVGEGIVTAVADGTVFSFQSGSLVAFTTQFGDALWTYPSMARTGSPAVLEGGMVSVSPDGVIVGIGGA